MFQVIDNWLCCHLFQNVHVESIFLTNTNGEDNDSFLVKLFSLLCNSLKISFQPKCLVESFWSEVMAHLLVTIMAIGHNYDNFGGSGARAELL